MKKLVILIVSALISTHVFAQLTGAVRTNFSEAFMQSCFNTQKSLAENRGLSEQVMFRYCKCMANYVADSMSNSLVRSIENGDQRMNPEIMQLSSKYCAKNYNKF